MASLKKNFVYSSILTTAGYVFPLLTYPYVTRILGVELIGLCNFVDSIVSYFILFSMMGISTIGIREIAHSKGNKIALSQTFSNLFFLNAIFTLIALGIFSVVVILVPKLHHNLDLMIIGGFKIIFNFLLIEWLYRGLEDFKFITIRSIIIRTGFVVGIFIWVKNALDYPIYYGLLCGMVVINACVNLYYSRKIVRITFENLNLKKFLKPFIILGLNSFLISMYTTFNVAYLGFISNDTEVGYYTVSTKIFTIILSLYSAFTGVLLPRMSSLVHEGRYEEFKTLLKKSISVLIALSVPLIIFSEFYAKEIVLLIAGKGYEGAILPMRIVMPLIFIIGYEQILIIQTLMPMKKDSAILRNSLVGAIIGLSLNIILVPFLYAIGSSLVWVACELGILILSQNVVNKSVGLEFPWLRLFKMSLYYCPIILLIVLSSLILTNYILGMVIVTVIIIVYFILLHCVFLHDEIGQYIMKLKNNLI